MVVEEVKNRICYVCDKKIAEYKQNVYTIL